MSEDHSASPRISQPRVKINPRTVVVPRLAGNGTLASRDLWRVTLLLLSILAPVGLLAQQSPSEDQGWSQPDYGQPSDPDSTESYPQQGYGPTLTPAQPLNAGQLEQLVAPIALYPDALVAQVLAASTYPNQVADADRWRQMEGYNSPEQIAAGADVQNWDPSVKALTAFPQVLAQMDRNLQWTTDLGNAYYNQPQDVMEAVQVMRQRARAAGTLESTPQQAVYYNQGYIQLMPVNPQVVYVPTYNPWTVYGDTVSPYPGFSLLGAVESFFGSNPISYGLGIALSAFSHTPWGWLAWGLNWLADTVLFNHSDYYCHSNSVADWGFRHDGWYAYAGRGGFGRRGFEHADGFHRFGGERNGGRGSGFNRSGAGYAGNWGRNSDRGFHSFGGGYGRNQRQGYSHMQTAGNWRQLDRRQFDRSGYGSNANRGFSAGYRGGSMRTAYGHSAPTYGASNSGFERRQFAGEPSRGFANRPAFTGQSFAPSQAKAQRSGGSHLFGGGYSPTRVSSRGSGGFPMGGGGHAPRGFQGGGKSFGGGRSFGGGKSFGGGRSFGGGKSFGGGRSFGGGKSFGGGHSGGGHSSGHGGGGGKHHR